MSRFIDPQIPDDLESVEYTERIEFSEIRRKKRLRTPHGPRCRHVRFQPQNFPGRVTL